MSLLNRSLLALCLLGSCIQVNAQSAAPDARTPVSIEPGQRVYEAETLLQDGALATNNLLQPPKGTSVSAARIPDMRSERPNGMRLFRLVLAPGEELRIALTSKGDQLSMRFLRPAVETPMASAIRKANLAPEALRKRKIAIGNTTALPQEAMLMVTGACGYAYRLDFQRTAEAP